jgi:FixJ family two-component response regulator
MAAQESPSTVYIVDDHAETVRSLAQLLRTVSLQTETFFSASAFLQRSAEPLDGCLILDLLMPEMNGLELLETLRERRNRIPAIIMTGRSDASLRARAQRSGAVAFLDKPVDEDELMDSISVALRAAD